MIRRLQMTLPPATEPATPKTPAKETKEPVAPTKELNRSAERAVNKPVLFNAAYQAPATEPAKPTEPAKSTDTEPKELPPINISVGPAGMIVTCEDPQVLQDFLNLAKTLASRQAVSQKEYTIYYLKFARAATAAELLEQIFASGGSSSSSSGSSSLLGNLAGAAFGDFGGGLMGSLLGLGGGTSSDSAPRLSSGSGTIQIVPETRLNALIVQASSADLDTIEQLLKVVDQPDSPEDLALVSKPRLIPVFTYTCRRSCGRYQTSLF